jgi:hypothetical protein
MTRKTLFAAALLAVAGSSAFAGGEFDPTRDYQLPVTQSTLTRAEVKADVARARASGELFRSDRDDHLFVQNVAGSTLTRAQVKAEVAAAVADGSIDQYDTSTEYARAPVVESTLTRAQVREETRTALRSQQRGRSTFSGS